MYPGPPPWDVWPKTIAQISTSKFGGFWSHPFVFAKGVAMPVYHLNSPVVVRPLSIGSSTEMSWWHHPPLLSLWTTPNRALLVAPQDQDHHKPTCVSPCHSVQQGDKRHSLNSVAITPVTAGLLETLKSQTSPAPFSKCACAWAMGKRKEVPKFFDT